MVTMSVLYGLGVWIADIWYLKLHASEEIGERDHNKFIIHLTRHNERHYKKTNDFLSGLRTDFPKTWNFSLEFFVWMNKSGRDPPEPKLPSIAFWIFLSDLYLSALIRPTGGYTVRRLRWQLCTLQWNRLSMVTVGECGRVRLPSAHPQCVWY